VLTQKDLYDFIKKNGPEAYDKMAAELADNINKAKDQYVADKKAEEEKNSLVAIRVGTLSDLFQEWFDDDFFKMVSPDQMAKSVYEAVEDFGKKKEELLKHAKNVQTETTDIPGGKKTVVRAELDAKDAKKALQELWDEFNKAFKY